MNKKEGSTDIIFPFPIISSLSDELAGRWKCFYESPIVTSRDRKIEEGLWRRTQDYENRYHSGWKNAQDRRRRMIHYHYVYDLIENYPNDSVIAITEFYLWWHVCMPKQEIVVYEEHIRSGLQSGGWRRVCKIGDEEIFYFGNLYLRILRYDFRSSIFDREASRDFPDNYTILEATFFSPESTKNHEFLSQPWKVLETGIRQKDVRGKPMIDKWDELIGLFPAQIELGCGPSIEANVPPLHFLHDVYSVTQKETGMFILNPYEDQLVRSLTSDPKRFLILLGEMYKRCFTANPTIFHHALKELYDYGHVVGPVITNNFDGLTHRVGLPELFVRRYDETYIIPNIAFHPRAKSLIVIGSHADRRRIQHAARMTGLRVVYVDPEGYYENGNFTDYPLESVQDQDLLFHVTANEFAERIKDIL